MKRASVGHARIELDASTVEIDRSTPCSFSPRFMSPRAAAFWWSGCTPAHCLDTRPVFHGAISGGLRHPPLSRGPARRNIGNESTDFGTDRPPLRSSIFAEIFAQAGDVAGASRNSRLARMNDRFVGLRTGALRASSTAPSEPGHFRSGQRLHSRHVAPPNVRALDRETGARPTQRGTSCGSIKPRARQPMRSSHVVGAHTSGRM